MYSNLRDAYRICRQCHGFIVVMLGDDHIFQGGAADETGDGHVHLNRITTRVPHWARLQNASFP